MKPKSPKLAAPEPKKMEAEKELGRSEWYQIVKYGLYRYQVFKVNLETMQKTRIGVENVYNVVASDLIDLLFKDINPERPI